MATKKSKDHQLAVRITPATRLIFINKSAEFGGTSLVLRELIEAFVEDRVVIKQPSIKGTIYAK